MRDAVRDIPQTVQVNAAKNAELSVRMDRFEITQNDALRELRIKVLDTQLDLKELRGLILDVLKEVQKDE